MTKHTVLKGDRRGASPGKYSLDTPLEVGSVMGSQTGEEDDDAIAAGGWAGTDDDTSTAPSDRMGIPEEDRLAELTGGAISDENPVIEGGYESADSEDGVLRRTS